MTESELPRPRPLPVRVEASIVSAVPGLVRIAAASWWRVTQWAITTSTAAGVEILKAVAAGESPAPIVVEATAELRSLARRALGLSGTGDAETWSTNSHRPGATTAELRVRGAALLRDSADVWFAGDTHPAYARILEELSPDEARILRFLAMEGPQPSIDVRTKRPFGVGSEVVATGLSMIGLQAGVRVLDRTKADLNNLFRLGLVWFSREQVDDPTRYQVVEVQPDVIDAFKQAGRSPKVVHRSILITPFGEDFCATCFAYNGQVPDRPDRRDPPTDWPQ